MFNLPHHDWADDGDHDFPMIFPYFQPHLAIELSGHTLGNVVCIYIYMYIYIYIICSVLYIYYEFMMIILWYYLWSLVYYIPYWNHHSYYNCNPVCMQIWFIHNHIHTYSCIFIHISQTLRLIALLFMLIRLSKMTNYHYVYTRKFIPCAYKYPKII